MRSLLGVSDFIDKILSFIANIGAWLGLLLVLVVCYDVSSRYFGVPKPWGLNSTQVQEFEYWLHTFLFALVMGFAYTKQAHVRIDLIREQCSSRVKFIIESLGIVCFLMTYAVMGILYSYSYAYTSFLEGEVSKSTIGLSNIWILKSMIPIMFGLIFLAGLSNLIKCIAGLTGDLPKERYHEALGGDHS